MKWRKLDWPQDQTEFRDFLFANKDYFTEYQMYSPSDEEIEQEFFLSIPAHAQLTQKEVFGIYQADQLMAAVDLLHDYERGTKVRNTSVPATCLIELISYKVHLFTSKNF